MRLSNKPRVRSSSTCSAETPGARARARAKVLENSISDPGHKKDTFSDEEEDFKFLESYVEKMGPRPEVGPVDPKPEPHTPHTIRQPSTEIKEAENTIKPSREPKMKLFKNQLPKLPFRSPMAKRKLGNGVRSFSETRQESFQDYNLQRTRRTTNSLNYNLERTRHSDTNSLDFYRITWADTNKAGSVSSNSRSSTFDSEYSTSSSPGSTERISSSSEVIMTDTIKRNVEKLEELAEEFEFLNNDLTNIVEEEHILLNADNVIPEDYINRLGALNLSAQSDIQRACLAYSDYMSTIKEIREAINSEEARVLERAGRLEMGNEIIFQKVPPAAVERLRGVSTEEEEPEQNINIR